MTQQRKSICFLHLGWVVLSKHQIGLDAPTRVLIRTVGAAAVFSGRGELGHCLRTLGHGVLGELARKHKSDRCLHLSRR